MEISKTGFDVRFNTNSLKWFKILNSPIQRQIQPKQAQTKQELQPQLNISKWTI